MSNGHQLEESVQCVDTTPSQCFLCRAYYWLGENIKFYEDIQTAEADPVTG